MVNGQDVGLFSSHTRGWEGVGQRIQFGSDILHDRVATINNNEIIIFQNYKEGKFQKSWTDVNYHKSCGRKEY